MIRRLKSFSYKFFILFLFAAFLLSSSGIASARGFLAVGDEAELVSRSPDPSVARDQPFSINITLSNIGVNTWEPGSYWLQNISEPMGANAVQPLSASVPQFGSSTWTINMVAPSVAGVYHTIWSVNHAGENFGPAIDFTVTVLEPNVRVTIAGVVQGKYLVRPNRLRQPSYVGLNNGPVRVQGLNLSRVLAGEIDVLMNGLTKESYSQMIGLPAGSLTTRYYFPVYNNVSVNEQIIFSNVGTAQTYVRVTIGGVVMGKYLLQPNQIKRVRYPGVNDGPVHIQSLDGQNIIAEVRDLLMDGTVATSWTQMMGLPVTQLSTRYYFPAYDNVSVNQELIFANVGTAETRVSVYIGGVFRGRYLVQPNDVRRVSYPGLDSGPVQLQSSDGVKIIAAMRALLMDGTSQTSWAQVMGLPAGKLHTTYYFPLYDNVSINEQLLIANVGLADTRVTIYIGGVERGKYLLHPNELKTVRFDGLKRGPVKIVSSGGVKIIAGERDKVWDSNSLVFTSWSQIIGMPVSLPYTQYYFPSYNNISLKESILLTR